MAERLLTRAEVAQQLGLSPKTLRNWAWRGLGPTVIYVSGVKQQPRYRQADVDAWLAGRTRGGEPTTPLLEPVSRSCDPCTGCGVDRPTRSCAAAWAVHPNA
jgi:hypothetical protein